MIEAIVPKGYTKLVGVTGQISVIGIRAYADKPPAVMLRARDGSAFVFAHDELKQLLFYLAVWFKEADQGWSESDEADRRAGVKP